MTPDTTESVAQWPLQTLVKRLADPRDPSGGGLLAAVTLASTAAVTQMVATIERKRARQDQVRAQAFAEAERCFGQLAEQLLRQADLERAILARLLATLRASRQGGARLPAENLHEAAAAAADGPLTTAEAGLELLRRALAIAPLCSRFVASDLAAAGYVARAAIEAALCMAEANMPLLAGAALASTRARARAIAEEASSLARQLASALPSTPTPPDVGAANARPHA